MANTRSANTYYVDTQYATNEELAVTNIAVLGVTVSATAASAQVVLADASSGSPKKLDLRVATSGESKHFDFSESPILFPNGIRPLTLTNAVATVIIREIRS